MIFDLVVGMKRFTSTNDQVNPRLFFLSILIITLSAYVSDSYKYIDLCIFGECLCWSVHNKVNFYTKST